MGLLDEAIREHLELKRRRGADPGEIARAERAALEPVYEGPPGEAPAGPAADLHDGDGGAHAPADAHPEQTPVEHAEAPAEAHLAEPALADFGGTGQETAEIDMRAVLDEDHHGHADAPAPEEALDWEMPARDGHEGPPEQVPGQERLSFE